MDVKNWIDDKITILKCWIIEYFLFKNSLEHLGNFMKKYYVLPIGFNDIYYGNKNMKRFIIFIINLVFRWFAVGFFLSFVLSDKIFSLIDVSSISSKHLKLYCLLSATIMLLIAVISTDLLLNGINYNFTSFKVIYYLMKDLKELHKLNEKNYKKLAILSRSIQILLINCGMIVLVIGATLFVIKIAILSGKIFWTWGTIIFILIYITNAATGLSVPCLYIIILFYYIMKFRQINHQIDLILDEKGIFFKRKILIIDNTKERQLISLIHEHNLAAIEIHKVNLIIRRTTACLFLTFAIMKIISLYLMVNINEFFMKMFLLIFDLFMLTFGFAGCYLPTLQIKSAHQPLKTVHSIVCKYKTSLRLKLKVS